MLQSVVAVLQLPLVWQQPYQFLFCGILHPGHSLDDVIEVVPGVDLLCLAGGDQRADDGHILRSFVAAAEEVVLASLCPGANYVGIIGFLNCRIDIFLRPTQHNFRGFSYIATVSLMKPCSICLIKFI